MEGEPGKRWQSAVIVEQRLERIRAWTAGTRTPPLDELQCRLTILKTSVQALRDCEGRRSHVISKLGAVATAIQDAAIALERAAPEGESQGAALEGEPHCEAMEAAIEDMCSAMQVWLSRHRGFSSDVESASRGGERRWHSFWWQPGGCSSEARASQRGCVSCVAEHVNEVGMLAAESWTPAHCSQGELETMLQSMRADAPTGHKCMVLSPVVDGSAWLWLLLVSCGAECQRFDQELLVGDRVWWTGSRRSFGSPRRTHAGHSLAGGADACGSFEDMLASSLQRGNLLCQMHSMEARAAQAAGSQRTANTATGGGVGGSSMVGGGAAEKAAAEKAAAEKAAMEKAAAEKAAAERAAAEEAAAEKAAAEKAAAENEAEGDGDEGGGDDKRGDEALEAAALAAGVPRHVFRAVVQVMGQLGRSGGLKKWVKHTAALLGVEKSELLREQVHEAGVRLLNAAEAPPPAAVATTQADKPSRTGKSSKAAAENEAKGELVRKRPCGVLSDPDDVGGRSGEVHTDGKPPGASAAPGKTASNSPTDDVQWRRVELGLTPRLIEASMTHLSRTISILFLPGQQTSTGGRLLGVIDSTETPLPHTDCGFDSGISSPSDHESEIKGLTVSGFLDFLSFSRCAACTRL